MNVSKDKLASFIKEIAENNDCGLDAFVNRVTLEVFFIPNENNTGYYDAEEYYEEDLKKIEENFDQIFKVEPPCSNESFRIMEGFADVLENSYLKTSLSKALNRKKPFSNFKYVIDNSEGREAWFAYKTKELIERVKFIFDDEMREQMQSVTDQATMKYRNNSKGKVVLRMMRKSDAAVISKAFKEQGWKKAVQQYQQYFSFQEEGLRDIIIAEINQEFAGYLTIQWDAGYLPFRKEGIPEIVDFNVLKKFQRRGIGTRLMNEAEARIEERADYAGVGFGVYKDYGPAQILYAGRGYIPDGNGLVQDSKSIKKGESVIIDDSIIFYMIKKLVE